MFDLTALRQAAELIGRHVPPTPQYNWPLLSQRLGCEVWVKHENHTPAGAFKVRGGLLYVHELLGREPRLPGMISATRGNHGISLAMAARQVGVPLKVLVPQGNSTERMRRCAPAAPKSSNTVRISTRRASKPPSWRDRAAGISSPRCIRT